MSKYYDNVSKEIKDYFKILEPDFPEWLNEYIDTKELLSQQYISVTCGTIYSDLFESDFFFSSLDHSVAVALIVWHFTHDKKQTLSGRSLVRQDRKRAGVLARTQSLVPQLVVQPDSRTAEVRRTADTDAHGRQATARRTGTETFATGA